MGQHGFQVIRYACKAELRPAPMPAKCGQRRSVARRLVWFFVLALISLVPRLGANPQGMTVQSGAASASQNGSQLTVTASPNAFLNWRSFNIGQGETTTFQLSSPGSVVWNRINDQNPSQIWGHLNANGIVVLMNQSGFYFGPGSVVNVAGLVVSTAAGAPLDFGRGTFWQFSGAPPAASIVNYGQINTGPGGSLFLIAEKIENHGVLMAPDGNIGLYSGKEVLVSERPDGRGLSAQVTLPSGSVDNFGKIVADAGTIAMHAQVVNQNGLVQANSVRERNGLIELVASETVNLGAESTIAANGDAGGASDGGRIVIKSDHRFSDATGSSIAVAGGVGGGNGGQVEISAPSMNAIESRIDGHAAAGSSGGRLIIDPTDIFLSSTGDGSAGTGSVNANDPPDTLRLNVNSAFVGFSQISLQATRDITVETTWNLEQSTGVADVGSKLTLEAGRNITINNGASLVAGQYWSVDLAAGRDFTSPSIVTPGVGSIVFSGTGSLETGEGSIRLTAGKDVLVNAGFVRTMAGGDIEVTALGGSVNAGTKPNGFQFSASGIGYDVDPNLGGISTANGGDVSITAGHDIISYLPTGQSGAHADGGSGAFGALPGDVTLTAGGSVYGHYVVRNGVGTIHTGVDAGAANKLLALSLVTGSWDVVAQGSIYLQEVRNPNGIFNNKGFSTAETRHLFDYSPDASVSLTAFNSVQLLGSALPRNPGIDEAISPIYAPSLNISAGAGGIVLGSDVTLFPSPSGGLNVTAAAGGSLQTTRAGLAFNLVMSDSGRTRYTHSGDFGISDHADVPLHLDDPNPVLVAVSGDVRDVLIGAPKRAEITVGHDMINASFVGQNLHPADVTSINVTGNIFNRNDYTFVTLTAAPDFYALENAVNPLPPLPTISGLEGRFVYNPQTGRLGLQGRLSETDLQALQNLQVKTYDYSTGVAVPVVDRNGEFVTVPGSFVNATTLQYFFDHSQDIPQTPPEGYQVGGPGKFNLTAHDMDLGVTKGIISGGPQRNPALANYSTTGADIDVLLGGSLSMFSSSIRSVNGGSITVDAGGTIEVGSTEVLGNSEVARGIYTTTRADVEVVATGDIRVSGSRIAAYDGGNITVLSREGNVDAGTGALGYARVERITVDPVTHQISSEIRPIPGSGILATSYPGSDFGVGNIRVETPRGDIIANAGGIVQLTLNDVPARDASVTLIAGSKDESGHTLYAGSIQAGNSGVFGVNVNLDATGDIVGVIIAQRDINLSSLHSVNVTAVAAGNVNVSAGGSISGTIVGVGGVSASGSSIDAALLSQNVSASGNVTSSEVGFAQTAAASAASASQNVQNDDPAKAATKSGEDDEESKKNKTALPKLARSTGRVTVVLPNSQLN